jgi:membrane protease subunit HflK
VKPEEQAVVTRFGKYLVTQPPGFHLKLPYGIDRAQFVKTEELRQQAFGFYLNETSAERINPFSGRGPSSAQNFYQRSRNLDNESLMLTGDLNVADVNWVVQYKISDPKSYLFHFADVEKTVGDISQTVMRQVVGDRSINDIITVGRAEIEGAAKELTQSILSGYDLGITIWAVKLQDVTPPELVVPSFNEVNAALQEQKQAINQAETAQNKVIPEARGKAEQIKSEARGFAASLLNHAKGDAQRFSQLVAQYKQAPQITRTRMYLELYEDIFKRVESLTVVDPAIKGLLPIFNGDSSTDSLSARAGLSRDYKPSGGQNERK